MGVDKGRGGLGVGVQAGGHLCQGWTRRPCSRRCGLGTIVVVKRDSETEARFKPRHPEVCFQQDDLLWGLAVGEVGETTQEPEMRGARNPVA